MADTKPSANSVPAGPKAPPPPPLETPVAPAQAQQVPAGAPIPAPSPAPARDDAVIAAPPGVEAKPAAAPPPPASHPVRPKYIWALIPAGILLAVALIVIGTGTRQKESPKSPARETQPSEEQRDLRNYSAFIAQNKNLRVEKFAEQILTDDSFAGQAPLAVRASGAVVSPEIDPQLAALADALLIRVQVMQGSRALPRGLTGTRATKGDFRGFRVNALEKFANGAFVSGEVKVETPKKGMIRTVNHLLDAVQKTDFAAFLSEIREAGLEFSPAPGGGDVFRAQLRQLLPWGKPVARELLIAGRSVGPITLGMSGERMRDQLIAAYIVLKRKVLVNDLYYDVYKILDKTNEPMLYVYEKQGLVWGISIISDAFRTEKGIGIGSTLDQMRIHYPLVKQSYSERKTPFVQVEDTAGIFIIQNEGDKKIISILVGESPEFE